MAKDNASVLQECMCTVCVPSICCLSTGVGATLQVTEALHKVTKGLLCKTHAPANSCTSAILWSGACGRQEQLWRGVTFSVSLFAEHMQFVGLPCCSYGESGVALLRPLAPGEPTWPELLEVVERRRQMEAAAAEAATAAAQVSQGTEQQQVVHHRRQPGCTSAP